MLRQRPHAPVVLHPALLRGCMWVPAPPACKVAPEGSAAADSATWGCRAPGEQLDVWVMRKADAARLRFWGISQMEPKAALEALSAVKSIWFLGKIPNDWDSRWCGPGHVTPWS